MKLELQLLRDGRVLFRWPIQAAEEGVGDFAGEIDEEDIEKLANLYSIGANERRLRVMSELMRQGEMSFSELLKVAMNPKLVRDCMEPLLREGMVIHERKRAPYRTSEKGAILALTMTAGVARLLDVLEEELGVEEGE